MVRHLFALSLMGILTVASGCSMCSDCMDEAPNYRGGLGGQEDMGNGRVGSAFTTVTVVDEDVITEDGQIIESAVYGASHQRSAGDVSTRAVRQAALTKKDLQETAAQPIATESIELTAADFDFEQ